MTLSLPDLAVLDVSFRTLTTRIGRAWEGNSSRCPMPASELNFKYFARMNFITSWLYAGIEIGKPEESAGDSEHR